MDPSRLCLSYGGRVSEKCHRVSVRERDQSQYGDAPPWILYDGDHEMGEHSSLDPDRSAQPTPDVNSLFRRTRRVYFAFRECLCGSGGGWATGPGALSAWARSGDGTSWKSEKEDLYVERRLFLELTKAREVYVLLKEGIIDALSIGYKLGARYAKRRIGSLRK